VLCDSFWFRQNGLNGYVYASFVSDETNTFSGIYVSNDNGATWSVYKTFTVPQGGYLGSPLASNFVSGTMYYSIRLGDGYENGVKFYSTTLGGSSNPVEQASSLNLASQMSQANSDGGPQVSNASQLQTTTDIPTTELSLNPSDCLVKLSVYPAATALSDAFVKAARTH
jgi:hypothetical protein